MQFKQIILFFFLFGVSFFAFAEETTAETIGEEDTLTESHLLFMKDTTVLLKKGDQRISASFSMTNDEQSNAFTIANRRSFSLALSYSLGVGYGTEVFVSIPVSQIKTKTTAPLLGFKEEKISSGFDNGVFGIKKTLFVQNEHRPEFVGSLSLSTSIGNRNEAYPERKSVTAGLMTIKSIDPVVIYGGFSFTNELKDGDNSIGFRLGSAFAVNHKIAFGGEFAINKTLDNDATISPVSTLMLRGTYGMSKDFSIEPSVSFGLSDDAPDTTFGLSFSWSL